MKAQRLRITFARGDDMKFITHLDVMRFWERALRRADIPVAYSEGFSPHAQISLAAPLAVGTTSDAELMDVFLSDPMQPKQFMKQLAEQIPPGISIVAAQEVGLALPALQAAVRFAEYLVDVTADAARANAPVEESLDVAQPSPAVRPPAETNPPAIEEQPSRPPMRTPADAEAAISAFLAATTIPWQHQRENETRNYDIRAQVGDLTLEHCDTSSARIRMRLKNDNTGSGRPEQVIAALGLPPPARIHRTKLILEGASPAREAWRTRGRFAD